MKGYFTSFFPRSQTRIMISILAITTLLSTLVGIGAFHTHSTRASGIAASSGSGDWSSYAANNRRVGFNFAETTINSTTAPKLKLHWAHQAGGIISDQPVEANSLIYWGSWDGLEHATNLSGTDVWATNLGTSTDSCTPNPNGVGSTSTIASVMINKTPTLVDFVGGGNGVFYALDANTGTIIWQTSLNLQPDDFLWSSPLLYNGSIYEGVAALTDCPTVQGKLVQMNAITGAIQHTFDVVPNGCTGGGVWGSPTVDPVSSLIYFATGNPSKCSTSEPLAPALIAVRAADLSIVSSWQVPSSQQTPDSDFGSTPTLFPMTINGIQHQFVGIGNKDGLYYIFDDANISNGPVWADSIAVGGPDPVKGDGVISPSAWNGTHLFVAGGNTTINGSPCQGSLRSIDPTTGAFLWQDCLSNPVIGAVSGVPGVIVATTLRAVVVVSAKTGNVLFTYSLTYGQFYSGASISNGVLYTTNFDRKLYAFGL